jgi:hypothetical protein
LRVGISWTDSAAGRGAGWHRERAPPPSPPGPSNFSLHKSSGSFRELKSSTSRTFLEDGAVGGMEESRTLVLTATMRSPTIGSPDQTQKRAHCAKKHQPRRATAPDFPHRGRPRRGPGNSKNAAKLGVSQARLTSAGAEVFSHQDSEFAAVQGVISRVRWEVRGRTVMWLSPEDTQSPLHMTELKLGGRCTAGPRRLLTTDAERPSDRAMQGL